nr:MAG TPA: hypothetical protein [Caudoviricetes sp.]
MNFLNVFALVTEFVKIVVGFPCLDATVTNTFSNCSSVRSLLAPKITPPSLMMASFHHPIVLLPSSEIFFLP